MPAPRKIDLIPEELRRWLAEELQARGFAEIIDVTEALNFRLEEAGLELSVGKSAVGEFSKALKDQRDAFRIAEVLLQDVDLEKEGQIHEALYQMIATSAMHMITAVRGDNKHLDPKSLSQLAKMLRDLMGSSQIREKLREDEAARVARQAKEEAVDAVTKKANELGLTGGTVEAIKAQILGVTA